MLQEHRDITLLPLPQGDAAQCIVVRRRHAWEDVVRKLKSGLNVNKEFKVTFVGETAVDEGGRVASKGTETQLPRVE